MAKSKKMKWWDWIAITLLTIGGLNWGLVGLSDYNLVEKILPDTWWKWVYIAVGISAAYSLVFIVKRLKK